MRRKIKEVSGRRGRAVSATAASRSTDGVDLLDRPHRVEFAVQHELLSEPHLRFSSLSVHRIANGVCLEGVVEVDDAAPDVCRLARRVSDVQIVVNHLLVHRPCHVPPKG